MKKSNLLLPVIVLISMLVSISSTAKEGMWIPSRIQQLVGDDMAAMGMKISAEELYSINKSSIKDAVVHFGGGCTSVLVSDKGLLMTNHHCGYSRIQAHSTVENDYLEDGFWAMTMEDELPNDGLTASIIKEIRDVSDEVLAMIPENASQAEREKLVAEKMKELEAAAIEGTHYEAYTRAFYYGNQYLLFITETFEDVRLVGAPPSSIGKFGFDTDNWVWPRHTGDFSVFRIYADKDNKPAKYSEDNQPYKPLRFLPVNMNGANEDDFTIVYGFPGRTENYIVGEDVATTLEVINPQRIAMRKASLGVIDQAMRSEKLLKIQYAAKQSRISNAYKKWIGQSKGLIRHKAIAKKDSLEGVFTKRVNGNEEWKQAYGGILTALNNNAEKSLPANVGRNLFIEYYYYGPEVLRHAMVYSELATMCKDESVSDEDIKAWVDKRLTSLGFFKNFNAEVDKNIMRAQLPIAEAEMVKYRGSKIVDDMGKAKTLNGYIDNLYERTMFADEEKLKKFLYGFKRNAYKKIEKDPAFEMANKFVNVYMTEVQPQWTVFSNEKDSLMNTWMRAQMEVIPERTYYADANSTLRITYGKVEGYAPFDGARYQPYTTLTGIMEKEDATNPEFVVPAKLKELYMNKDYGRYADSDGEVRVAFISSNHTSGGNSGSPVIDASGNLIGLNFDRTWESTMSDIMFNAEICRNITVDIRYVLFIMDKFANAGHLVDEMTLVE